jgi:shikimate dehydrogenase
MSAANQARRLGVLGWPVAHSRSPAMHNAAFAALGMQGWRYQRLPVPPELLTETVRALPRAGFLGVNVTIPHKQAALALADSASLAAREIGAANTLTFGADGSISAENTDAPGLLQALRFDVRGRTAMVLGAGGSARAAVWALLGAGAEVLIWNRTRERAATLAAELGGSAVAEPAAADLLINCTAVGLRGAPGSAGIPSSSSEAQALNHLALSADQVAGYPYVFDLVYAQSETPLLALARRAGAETIDGLEMLVAQGAISFAIWTGRQPPRDLMRAAARGAD